MKIVNDNIFFNRAIKNKIFNSAIVNCLQNISLINFTNRQIIQHELSKQLISGEYEIRRLKERYALLKELIEKTLPTCQAYGGGHAGYDDDPFWICGKIATRKGACDPHDSYVCDHHKCRHECPELPYAELVRQYQVLIDLEKPPVVKAPKKLKSRSILK